MLRRIYPDIVIFSTGAFIMMFELAGSRILGPYCGSSVIVWSSLIGIIFGSLSLGYSLGGWLSKRKIDYTALGWILLLTALFIFLTTIGHDKVLKKLKWYIEDERYLSMIASIVLFAPANLFFGMILPYIARIKIEQVNKSGVTVGKIYAISTGGSLVGTFTAGFYLIPVVGFDRVIVIVMFGMLIFSFIAFLFEKKKVVSFFPVLLLILSGWFLYNLFSKTKNYIDTDTSYNRVIIYDSEEEETGKRTRILKVNNETSSAMYLDQDGLVFEVLKYYHLADHFVPSMKNSLMIGGSGYAFPKDYLLKYPDAQIDVVEIDPGLTELARQYFELPDDDRLYIIHEDGRTYLNRCNKTYDAIFVDAYKSQLTIPYQLTTKEAIIRMYESLHDQGAVFANIISVLDNTKNHFLRAELATYRDVFPQVFLFAVKDPTDKGCLQNFMLVAMKSEELPLSNSEYPEIDIYLRNLVTGSIPIDLPILTDDFAPVDYYTNKLL
ncbi:MAG: fused MFS/spermidine synthase [Bacteroidales bacterium]|nr:fused MFS/spermidine synthase [Bacteroidales bacterium]